LHGPGRVLQNLHRFQPGQFVEEPATTGVHQHGVPLKLKHPQGHNLFGYGQRAHGMTAEEAADVRGRTI